MSTGFLLQVVPSGDIVALLLENESSRHYEYNSPKVLSSMANNVTGYAVSTLPSQRGRPQSYRRVASDTHFQDNLMHSSGRQSPSIGQYYEGSSGVQRRGGSTSSQSGAASFNRYLLNKTSASATPEEREAAIINRFREVCICICWKRSLAPDVHFTQNIKYQSG